MPNSGIDARTLTRAQIADVMREAGWNESDIPMGVAIALAESGGRTAALNTSNSNGSRDYGLFQINSVHKALLDRYDWRDPVQNAAMARKIFEDAGRKWTPWSVYKSGSYKKFFTGKSESSAGYTIDDGGLVPNDSDGLPGGEEWIVPNDSDGMPTDSSGDWAENTELGKPFSFFDLGFIGTPMFWQRFGIGALGVALVITGIIIVFRQPIGDTVVTVASRGTNKLMQGGSIS